ncbi:MAG TPA: hypothetical protein VIX82_18825 [Solirubrobacteraceae bacterium]
MAVLRYFHEAVSNGDAERTRSAVGAALATNHVRDLRRYERRLVRALRKLDGEAARAPATKASEATLDPGVGAG